MKYALRILAVFTTISLVSCNNNSTTDSRMGEIDDIFRSEGIVATLIVEPTVGEKFFIYNEPRSVERFSPASTFKIPNTLIALENLVVESKNSVFEWDGTDKGMQRWNQDQTLESAFKVSCLWCYQEIARIIGTKRYEAALEMLGYGNQLVGDEVDAFWINGDLQISAREQITFLRQLTQQAIPYQHRHIETLKNIMLVEQTASYSIYAKTGWAGTTPQVAWYVGFVTKGDETWLFAMNMRVDHPEQASLRKELTVRSLKALKII